MFCGGWACAAAIATILLEAAHMRSNQGSLEIASQRPLPWRGAGNYGAGKKKYLRVRSRVGLHFFFNLRRFCAHSPRYRKPVVISSPDPHPDPPELRGWNVSQALACPRLNRRTESDEDIGNTRRLSTVGLT